MKLLVLGIDAVSPDLVYNNLDKLPNLKFLTENGAYGEYDGYVYGYGSRDNWISMYTGLKPEIHGVVNNIYKNTNKLPRLGDYSDKQPFWKIINEKGFRVGLWKAISTTPPEKIDGYIASGEYSFEANQDDQEINGIPPIFIDEELNKLINKKAPAHPLPRDPEDFNLSWDVLFDNPLLINSILKDDYFQEGLLYLEEILEYQLTQINVVNKKQPVDLFWFYDPVFDFLCHFQMHDPSHKIILEALKIIDQFVGKMTTSLNPENVIFISDHGQKSYHEHFPNTDLDTRKEAFGLADQSVMTENYTIVKARNGGFLSAAHSLKAVLICSGPLFNNKVLKDVRNADIYPLLLELFDCEIPGGRDGKIPDILNKEIFNKAFLKKPAAKRRKVAVICNYDVPSMNHFINQYYLENRYHDLYVLCEEKLKSIYQCMPQVKCLNGISSFDQIDLYVLPTKVNGKIEYKTLTMD